MARAHRYFIPGYIWHITHRCHKKEFLLKFAKDRHRWLQWLYQAKKRYGLVILNYMVTSNHIHLLVYDDAASGKNVIPRSMQLVAGRTGQEYNLRKHRNGAYWEDRYHATAVESGDHLVKCLVYIDLNMVRAGVVKHPGDWPHSGYNEIQSPKRKCVLVDHYRLMQLAGFTDYGQFCEAHENWLRAATMEGPSALQPDWSKAIAVGGSEFVQEVKDSLRALTIGRQLKPNPNNKSYELKEAVESYRALFDPKKDDIAHTNTYNWDENMCVYK